jgi:hypothetical protein
VSTATLVRGVQTPRLQLAPPAVLNLAQDAIDVYESCGQRLDEWQELCLRVGCGLREDMNWASFENGIIVSRQNGKGADIEALCLASLFVWGNKKTVYSAHRGDTVKSTFERIKSLIESNPDLLRRCEPINPSDDEIRLIGGGGVLVFKTRTRSGGRGLTGDLVILDEALELNIDQITALVPIMAARPYAQLWYFSTVPKFADQHLCSVRERVLAGAVRLAWAEWGVDRGDDLHDPKVLARANPAMNIRITWERLEDLRKILGEDGFATECAGIWPGTAQGAMLDKQTWKGLCEVTSMRAPDSDVVLSMDTTPLRDHGSIGMHGWRVDGLEHLQLTDYDAGVDWMVARAAALHELLDPLLWVIDPKSGVGAMLPALAEAGIKVAKDPKALRRGEILLLDTADIAACVGQFVDAFRAVPPPLRHIGQQPLDDAVGNVKPRPIGDAGQIAWGRRLSTVDIGPLVVVSQARYGSHIWAARKAPPALKSMIW